MIVRCTSNLTDSLPNSLCSAGVGFDKGKKVESLQIGKDYVVFGLAIHLGVLWYFVIADTKMWYPTWYPAPFFDVIDGALFPEWVLSTPRSLQLDMLISIPEWANDASFYERLLEGGIREREIFARYRARAELVSGIGPT